MSKSKDFIQDFKLTKALGNYDAAVYYGDKLHMFNCVYKVASFDKKGYTVLEDEKNSKFAIPSKKLLLLMKKGLVYNSGPVNFSKSMPGGNPQGPTKGQPKGEPVGTVKQGKDGQWYQKISSAPSKWAHVKHGTTHPAPGEDKHHAFHDPKVMAEFSKILIEAEKKGIHPEDKETAKKKLMELYEEKHKLLNLRHTLTMKDMDEKGEQANVPGLSSQKADNLMEQHDKFIKKFKEVKNFLSSSREKMSKK